MGGVLIAAVPASGMIMILVQVAKRLGLGSRFAPLLSITLGVAYTLIAHLVQLLPSLRGWYEAVGAGLTIGLSACGLYSGSKAMFGASTPRVRPGTWVRARVTPALGDGSDQPAGKE